MSVTWTKPLDVALPDRANQPGMLIILWKKLGLGLNLAVGCYKEALFLVKANDAPSDERWT